MSLDPTGVINAGALLVLSFFVGVSVGKVEASQCVRGVDPLDRPTVAECSGVYHSINAGALRFALDRPVSRPGPTFGPQLPAWVRYREAKKNPGQGPGQTAAD